METGKYSSIILDLGTRRRCVVNFRFQMLYHQGKSPQDPLQGGSVWTSEERKEKKIPFQEMNPGHLVCNQNTHYD
jgi:hypothetical protein